MNICVCGKHFMRHLVGNMFAGYIHYDYTPICAGGTDELERRLPDGNAIDSVLVRNSDSSSGPAFDSVAYARSFDKAFSHLAPKHYKRGANRTRIAINAGEE